MRPIPPNPDAPQHRYEIICGHRRHATILQLHADGIQIPFLADIRNLTDAEAFRAADIDNRERADISAYLRAQTYADAFTAHFNENQAAMAQALNLATSTLNRYLLLAALPEPIVKAYYNKDAIRLIDAETLRPLLADPRTASLVLAKAEKLASWQFIRRFNGQRLLLPATILKRLTDAAAPAIIRHDIRSPAGCLIARGHRTPAGAIAMSFPKNPHIALQDQIQAATKLLAQLPD